MSNLQNGGGGCESNAFERWHSCTEHGGGEREGEGEGGGGEDGASAQAVAAVVAVKW